MELVKHQAGVNISHIPYKGFGQGVNDVMAGHVPFMFDGPANTLPMVKAGKVKVLAVTTPQRSPMMPSVPTFTEEGFPDMQIYIWSGFSAPAGTPDALVQRIQAVLAKALKSEAIIEKWRPMDFHPLPFTADEYLKFIRTDAKRWQEAVKISGFKASE